MLETQTQLDKKITEIKDCHAEIRQLKLKLSAALTEKHLRTSPPDSPTDFYPPPPWTPRLSEKISDPEKLSDKKSPTFEAWQLQMKLKLTGNQDQYSITQK